MSGPPRLPRVPPGSPIPDLAGPEPSAEAFRELWSKTRVVRVYPGGLGEHGPLARDPSFEVSGSKLDELFDLLSFQVSGERFRFMSLGAAAFELRGRVLRVGLLAIEAGGGLRVSGWGSDVRLLDASALFAWLARNGGPSLRAQDNTSRPAASDAPQDHAAKGVTALEGGAVAGASEEGGDLRDLFAAGQTLVALDGGRLVAFDGQGGATRLGAMDRVVGCVNRVVYGVRGRDLLAVDLGAEGPAERVIRQVALAPSSAAVATEQALYVATSERRGHDEPMRSALVCEPLSGSPSARVFEAKGLVTALSASGEDLGCVVRCATKPWFGAPRARHELFHFAGGAAKAKAVYAMETEPGVALSLSLGRLPSGLRAFLWSPERSVVQWVDLPQGTSGEIDAGGAVLGLSAHGPRAFAIASRGEDALAVVALRAGGPAEPIASFRTRPRRFDVAVGGERLGVLVGSELVVFSAGF